MDARRWLAVIGGTAVLGLAGAAPAAAQSGPYQQTGRGGAAATLDRTATRAAIAALRQGGNAMDAAIVAAGVLGVTEPFSSGIGGGGFMTIYDGDSGRVSTIDSREESPSNFGPRVFLDAQGKPLAFPDAVYSGLSVGVPGTVSGWDEALRRFGTWSLSQALQPGIRVARNGFRVDQAFIDLLTTNPQLSEFTSTRELYFPRNGRTLRVGATQRNPDLAKTYGILARRGVKGFYDGKVARAILRTIRRPPVRAGSDLDVRRGLMTKGDLEAYQAIVRRPTRIQYRGYDVYGMAPPSSGGSTVGEALNILEGFDLGALPRAEAYFRYLEASKLAYADRGAYLGDPEFFDVPLAGLLSDSFAAERRSLIGTAPLPAPQPAGNPFDNQSDPSPSGLPPATAASVERGRSTTHITVSDRDGNVVSYTFTIEQTGGNGMVVPGYGFLLNNELTDFNFVPPGANAPEPNKRPRSSISPTIVLRNGRPAVALGAPGGSTIITAVLQVLMEHLDFDKSLPDAIAAPRAAERNFTATEDVNPTSADPEFIRSAEGRALAARGYAFEPTDQLGRVTGIDFLGGGRVTAAAEPVRNGGGSAMVERPNAG